ncbi:unnamed protein product [Oppiella nova]|uniref:Uncharacterized protein n=1 Tax=Oppiella nova TaxID=334625 RepID=A0A7R9QEF2_9ACAR|nr:unnamed protein product [Oppiella nova]CAG2164149.1 unnamed protein product [Oppiella nova]
MEYIGEIITIEEADHRGAIYDAGGITYLFDLDYNEEVDGYKYALDATHSGNVSHFVNHSCDPNLDTRVVWVNNLDPFMPHIALFAIKHIKMNEELTFDYKINVQRITASANGSQISCSERSFDSGFDGSTTGAKETREAKTLAVTCRCGAHNCRQFLYSLPPSQTS